MEPNVDSPSGKALAHAVLRTLVSADVSRSTDVKNCSSDSFVGFRPPSGSTYTVRLLPLRILEGRCRLPAACEAADPRQRAAAPRRPLHPPRATRECRCHGLSSSGYSRHRLGRRGHPTRVPRGGKAKQHSSASATTPQKTPTRMSNVGTTASAGAGRNHRRRDAEDGGTDTYPQCSPRDASTRLSVSSCRTIRRRPAPRAERMASSLGVQRRAPGAGWPRSRSR